ncbi:hypothetical protein MLD38_012639 [Melastoma candidum]|uniref:Uncharacterized protein n=1 Tax=Melastoma candidum TaxID=119954 RepID=A0ACB9R899_9MYRT|nr:hypothetical protein MLD38_012639 [Melastoma candidum]
MTSGARTPTWRERENNKRRERRRRAIAAKIFAGLRIYGNYRLPKHCDNNEVLKALCNEAGWVVEPDGTTYRKGCKPVEHADFASRSAVRSSSTFQPNSCASYNPSPCSSSFPSPASSSYATNANVNGNLIPWLKNLSSASSSASSSKLPFLSIPGNSISAPVTPYLNSPLARSPRVRAALNEKVTHLSWREQSSFPPFSTPPSPGRQFLQNPEWMSKLRIPQSGPVSPTFSLVSPNPLGLKDDALAGSGSRAWTPGQSGTCSPAIPAGADYTADIPMSKVISAEFAFGADKNGLVKPWEGEKIHEGAGSDDLELTLGGGTLGR